MPNSRRIPSSHSVSSTVTLSATTSIGYTTCSRSDPSVKNGLCGRKNEADLSPSAPAAAAPLSTVPDAGLQRPRRTRRRLDLPAELLPTMSTFSLPTSRLMSEMRTEERLGGDIETLLILKRPSVASFFGESEVTMLSSKSESESSPSLVEPVQDGDFFSRHSASSAILYIHDLSQS